MHSFYPQVLKAEQVVKPTLTRADVKLNGRNVVVSVNAYIAGLDSAETVTAMVARRSYHMPTAFIAANFRGQSSFPSIDRTLL